VAEDNNYTGGNYPVGLPRETPAVHMSPLNLWGYWTECHQICTQYIHKSLRSFNSFRNASATIEGGVGNFEVFLRQSF